ncbi:MAG: Glycosyl transferase family 2 [candidate division TM6 bacterium GW2011_GWF2_28_16]|nr:MAG: Glycosyl transferase family 2 [candidate division TM6 bacterium GW2011_GWF2_28_16]
MSNLENINLLSVITPIFNEQDNINTHYQELTQILSQLKYFKDYEIIFINDGSTDNSINILKELSVNNKKLKIINFTRNFGHEAATTAGINSANGDAIVIIDGDMQDPAELILEFEKEYINNFDIVYGQRSKRLKESLFKKITSKAFYPIFKILTKIDMPKDTGDFCLLSRRAINIFNQLPEKSRFVRGLIYWSGLPKKALLFVRRERNAGKTKYNYKKLTIFALENIISFSTVPIYFMIFFSMFLIFTCFLGVIATIIIKLMGYVIMSGWASLVIIMLFLFAVTFFFLGIIGLYIGKIFEETKNRPTYLIDEKINF